jgi:acyl-CoA synthetase (AMP-forming)/AMP-acid ligase II
MAEPYIRLHEPVRAWSQRAPARPALSEGDTTWTFAQLAAAVDEALALLHELGVRRGDRVMLIGENSLALAAFILAVGAADATAVMENARRAPHEVDLIRQAAEPRQVLYFSGASPDAAAHAERHGALARRLPLNGPLHHAAQTNDSPTDPVAGDASDTAVLIYTTGTTGVPKGVMLSHANLLYLSRMMVQLREVTPADRVYGVLPITHVMGLAGAFNGTLRAGAHLRLVARFAPAECARALQSEGITMLQGAPAMFAKLAEHARRHPFTAPALRFIAAGGAPIDDTVKAGTEALFNLPLHNGYGLSEGSGLSWTRLDQPRADCSVGLPLPGVELKVLDAEGQPVKPGVVGELWARGPNVMKGYYRQPELTAKVLKPDGWFNTEDLARIDPADGHVHVEGRTKDLIIAGGFNVYPLEVEMALNAHPAVVHSAVVGRKESGSETVVAFVELAPGSMLTQAELAAHLAPRLSPYKRPREVWVLPALPVSPNGKVLKKQLQALAQQGATDGAVRLR